MKCGVKTHQISTVKNLNQNNQAVECRRRYSTFSLTIDGLIVNCEGVGNRVGERGLGRKLAVAA
jgi:hypothetical protein